MLMNNDTPLKLPDYHVFIESIASLALSISASELHGIMCGYLSVGAIQEGEMYLQALLAKQQDATTRAAALLLFSVYTVSQQQMMNTGFEFQLLLPDEHESLAFRAEAFSQWCEGFTQGMAMAGVDYDDVHDEDAQDAIGHLIEFAHLDYRSLSVDEDDERALMEVCEYARMAVLHIHSDLHEHTSESGGSKTAH